MSEDGAGRGVKLSVLHSGRGHRGEDGKAQPELESLELTSGRSVAVRSLGLTKLIWML